MNVDVDEMELFSVASDQARLFSVVGSDDLGEDVFRIRKSVRHHARVYQSAVDLDLERPCMEETKIKIKACCLINVHERNVEGSLLL
jgi:hypothetical protein